MYFTPEEIVEVMIEEVFKIKTPKSTDTFFEPCAGRGAFVRGLLRKKIYDYNIFVNEIDERNARYLDVKPENKKVMDILDYVEDYKYDYIITNPPFTNVFEKEGKVMRN